jgi:hypothetical protein
VEITRGIYFLLALALLFLFQNNPTATVKEMANFNLLLIGGVGVLAITAISKKKEQVFYEVKNAKDFFGDAALGVIFGGLSFLIIGGALVGLQGITSLLGSVGGEVIAQFNSTQLFFVAVIYPVTETIILVGGTLFLYNFIKNVKFIPFKKIVSAFAIILLFASFHFNSIGKNYYEYSASGFINFVGEMRNLNLPSCNISEAGQACYSGALPVFLLGLFWVALALAFKSWVVPAFAHITWNTVTTGMGTSWASILPTIAILLVGIVLIVAIRHKGFQELKTFDLTEVLQ